MQDSQDLFVLFSLFLCVGADLNYIFNCALIDKKRTVGTVIVTHLFESFCKEHYDEDKVNDDLLMLVKRTEVNITRQFSLAKNIG